MRLAEKYSAGKGEVYEFADERVGKFIKKEETDAEKIGLTKEDLEEAERLMDPESAVRAANLSQKTMWRDVKKACDQAQIIVMVLDARDPEGTRISEIEDYAQKNSKKVIMLLNKSDLAPNTTEWQAYFKQKGIISMVYQANEALKKEGDEETEDLSGSEKLQTLLFKYSKKFAEKKDLEQLCVAVVGYPNTGKSSAINLLVNRHVCNTGSSPFITKAIKQISLNRQVIVLDTPAVMKSNVSDNIRSAMQVDDIIDPIKAVEQLFDKVEKSEFLRFYRIGAFKTAEELSEQVAKKETDPCLFSDHAKRDPFSGRGYPHHPSHRADQSYQADSIDLPLILSG